jgi:hypothetical protein
MDMRPQECGTSWNAYCLNKPISGSVVTTRPCFSTFCRCFRWSAVLISGLAKIFAELHDLVGNIGLKE